MPEHVVLTKLAKTLDKNKKNGVLSANMIADCIEFAKKCQVCQYQITLYTNRQNLYIQQHIPSYS